MTAPHSGASDAGGSHTSVAHERWVARQLGLEPEIADAVIARLEREGRLGDGLACTVFLHATRRGKDPSSAAEELAAGDRALPRAPSDYELRTVGDEISDAYVPTGDPAPGPPDPSSGVPRTTAHLDVG